MKQITAEVVDRFVAQHRVSHTCAKRQLEFNYAKDAINDATMVEDLREPLLLLLEYLRKLT